MSRRYQPPIAKEQNIVRKIVEEDFPENGFLVVKIDGCIRRSYLESLNSWVTLREGTIYPSYETAYQHVKYFSDKHVAQYVIMTLEEVNDGYYI